MLWLGQPELRWVFGTEWYRTIVKNCTDFRSKLHVRVHWTSSIDRHRYAVVFTMEKLVFSQNDFSEYALH